jgi:hypothetical protein
VLKEFGRASFTGETLENRPVEFRGVAGSAVATVINRENVQALDGLWKNKEFRGCYILLGPRMLSGEYHFYVGLMGDATPEEGGNTFAGRMFSHGVNPRTRKEFWVTAVLVSDESPGFFDSSQVKWMEGELDRLFSNVVGTRRVNIAPTGDRTTKQEAREACYPAIETLLRIVQMLGYSAAQKPVKVEETIIPDFIPNLPAPGEIPVEKLAAPGTFLDAQPVVASYLPEVIDHDYNVRYPAGLKESDKAEYADFWMWRQRAMYAEIESGNRNVTNSGYILGNNLLVTVMKEKPRSLDQLMNIQGVSKNRRKTLARYWDDLDKVIAMHSKKTGWFGRKKY